MSDDSASRTARLREISSRRRFLQGIGAMGTTALAGCSDDGDGGDGGGGDGGGGGGGGTDTETTADDDSGDGGDGGQPMDDELTLDSLGVPASDVQWNEFNFANYKWMVQAHIMDPFAVYDPVNKEFVGMALEDWSIDLDNRTMTMNVAEDYHWHDGEAELKPLTSEDFYRHFKMEQHMGWSSSNYVSEIRTPDDKTVEVDLKGEAANKSFIRWNLLTNVLSHGMPVYDEWLDRFKNEESDAVSEDLSGFSISTEEMVSYGPFAVKTADQEKIHAVKNTGHPASGDINFPKMAWKYVGGGSQNLWQSLSGGDLDGHVRMNVPADVALSFPDHIEYTTYASLGGLSVATNWEGKDTSDPRVRQAIAYIIDQKQATRNAGGTIRTPVTEQVGMSPDYASDYVDMDNYRSYPKDHEKATQLLKDAGYTKENGQWKGPDGSNFGPTLKASSGGGPNILAAQTIASQLSSFGLDTRLQTFEGATFQSDVLEAGNYQLAVTGWGAGYPHPYAWYNDAINQNGRKSKSMPKSVELPEIGNFEGEPGAVSVELDTDVESLSQISDKKMREMVSKLAWVYNWGIPEVQIFEEENMTWFTNDHWEYPDLDSDIMQRRYYTPFHAILKTGKFRAKTQ